MALKGLDAQWGTTLNIYSSFFFKEADVLLSDTLEAARWCELQTFKGTVPLPSVIGMDGEDRLTTLKELQLYDGLDEETNVLLNEPFMLQRDYELFYVKAVDNKKITVFVSFEEQEWSGQILFCLLC